MNIELTDDFLEAAIELRYTQSEMKKLEAQEKRCKEIIAKHLSVDEIGTDAAGNALVKIQKGASRFKAELAIANLPANVLESIMVTAPDATTAKQLLAPALYDLCTQEGSPVVKVV